MDDDRLLTTTETAEFLGVSKEWLEVDGRRNGPRHVRLAPRCVRYRMQEIQDWIDQRVFQTVDEALAKGQRISRHLMAAREKRAS